MTINLIRSAGSVHHAQVEWDALSTIIAQFAFFERNKEILAKRIFSPEELGAELARVDAYLHALTDDERKMLEGLLHRLPADNRLGKFVAHVKKSGQLSFPELHQIALLLETGIFIKAEFVKITLPEFRSIEELDFAPVNKTVLKEFRYLVDSDGELHLERHPELADLTKRLRELEDKIRRTVQDWMHEPEHHKLLQYASYDIHFDRFVVPVRSDSYRSELGLIVSRSETGSTLFVEPFVVRETCNRRLELIAKIDEIITQLAGKFSAGFASHSGLIEKTFEEILRMEYYLAKSAFAGHYQLEKPTLREKPGYRISGLFHPLLKNPVKNDVVCEEGQHGIVISGPNTGGKTVFLKSLALTYLLVYHGHFVPAREAELFPYEGLFYFGDDLQDLKTGLSSFSGEVRNYLELLEHLLPTNLILIDEIFNSTSSDEASALSLAYFDELHQRGLCHLVVSTHHQMFKTLVHQDQKYISCHVGFDAVAMKPTYKIIWGTPGSSMAIDVFRILSQGKPAVSSIPERALSQLSQKNISYETLLQRVTQSQIELDRLLEANRQREIELRNQKGAMEGVLNLKLQDALASAKKDVERILDEARKLVEAAREDRSMRPRRIDDREAQLKAELSALGPSQEKSSTPVLQGNLSLEDLQPGDTVHSLVLKKDFVVQSVDRRKSEVLIAKGPIKISVPLRSLTNARQSGRQNVSVSIQKTRSSRVEFDVRGMRLAECQNIVEQALGDLLSGDVPYVSIIHGHGDGVLKNWLRSHLKNSRDFTLETSETGNDGETRIGLK